MLDDGGGRRAAAETREEPVEGVGVAERVDGDAGPVVVDAAGQAVEMRDNRPVSVTTVTLALTPEQAERLALAQNEGKLTIGIRYDQPGLSRLWSAPNPRWFPVRGRAEKNILNGCLLTS